MSKIDYQALREAAQKAKELGNISRYTKATIARLEFKEADTPDAVLALLDELEAAEKRIAELEAKLDSADKLQDSAFRHGLQNGFSFGQTDNQAGFEECLSAYGTGKGE
ncbi:TPA: ead/Ea22-like family protein [Enterobacter cloacae]|uniref:ead/Ea22-like family protein n=1 Tax=Enterobacter TaxID=547 RepID=UPI000795F7E4|nr:MULTISPECIES: ead/Ea22-like family protein [Enterobacter]HAS0832080.1 ead/Ea22-like family protein [Enterobacter cloacae subsp. cloacae]NWJ82532.1 ead/Ea22-like family protein [Enterobacter sp. SECR19-1250]QUG51560.1 ead/Ea22-like family protein [Enterobacter cloacae]SAE09943.1 Uncharacterised protein [Enterobacter roggenkampii]HDS4823274.1 ead/Ea22-like family protein [Enterobacter cloacae]